MHGARPVSGAKALDDMISSMKKNQGKKNNRDKPTFSRAKIGFNMSEETFRANVSRRDDQDEDGEEVGFHAGSGDGSNALDDTSAAAFFTGAIRDPDKSTQMKPSTDSAVHSGGLMQGDRSF